jgi:integrase
MAVKALREHQERQRQQREIAGAFWQEHGLVFGSKDGTPLDRSYVRWSLRLISRSADVPVEEIARLTGHSDIRTTETVNQHELRTVIRTGAGVIYRLLGEAKGAIGTLAV